MKKLLILFSAFALCAAATSCSQDEMETGIGGNESLKPAAAGNLTIRLLADGNTEGGGSTPSQQQSSEEQKVAKLRVLVFRNDDGLLEMQKDFTPKQSQTTISEVTLPVSEGTKDVVLLANYGTYPENIVIESTRYADFLKTLTTFACENGEGKNMDEKNQGLLANGGCFMMSGTKSGITVTATAPQEGPQPVSIPLTRFAAKVTIENDNQTISAVSTEPGDTKNSKGFDFELEILGFKRGNVRKSFNTFQQLDEEGKWTSPDVPDYTPAGQEGEAEADPEKEHWARYFFTDVAGSDYSESWKGPHYFTENRPRQTTDGGAMQATTSYILVKANVKPKCMFDVGSANNHGTAIRPMKIENNHNWINATTRPINLTYSQANWYPSNNEEYQELWYVTVNGQWFRMYEYTAFFFKNPMESETVKNKIKETDLELTNTKAYRIHKEGTDKWPVYFRIWLTNNVDGPSQDDPLYHAVARNEWFKIQLTKILGIGMNSENGNVAHDGSTEDPIEPDKPVEPVSNLQFRIEVLPWDVIDQNTPLG